MKRIYHLSLSTVCTIAFILFSAVVSADEASDRFTAAKGAFDSRQYEQAKVAFGDFIAKYPSHVQSNEAMFYLAESLLNLRQYDAASNYYNRLVALGLTNQYARVAFFRLADIPYIQGQYDVAKPRLEGFIEKLPHDTNLQFVLYYLGDIAMRSNTPSEAEWYFGQSEKMYPAGARIVESKLGLAWAKNQLGNKTASNAIFHELLASKDPKVLEPTTYQWGVVQFERGDNRGAATTLTGFLTTWPASIYYADAQRVLARSKGAEGDYTGALQVLSQITQPTVDDTLMKVRCLYGTGQTQEAYTMLIGVERVAGPGYVDEVAFLKSVFHFDKQEWTKTIELLSGFLVPNFNARSGKMVFGYHTLPVPAGGHKLSDETYMKACALLALAYARNGESAKADATLAEMQGEISMSTTLSENSEMREIVAETKKRLSEVYAQNNSRPNVPSGRPDPNLPLPSLPNGPNNQWGPNWNYDNSGDNPANRPGRPNSPQGGQGSGTDMDRLAQASQLYNRRDWTGTANLLDQLLSTQYNQWSKQFYINYTITGAAGTLSEIDFVRACSLLALARAELGDFDQAGAVYSVLFSRVRTTDSAQQDLLRQTYDQLTRIAQNGVRPNGNSGTGNSPQTNIANSNYADPFRQNGPAPLISDSEQRKILRECKSLYEVQRFEQVNTKLRDLMSKRPSDAVMSEAALLRSKALLELGNEHESISLLEMIVHDYSESVQYADALWCLGLYYEACGDSYKGIEYFQMLADRFPNYKNIDGALYFLALDDMENGNGRRSSTYLKRIYSNFQNGKYWSHAAWTLAYESYRQKDYEQAEVYLKKVLQHPPDVVILDRVLYLRGQLALRKREYDTAVVAFREVGRQCPQSPLRDDADRNVQLASKNVSTIR